MSKRTPRVDLIVLLVALSMRTLWAKRLCICLALFAFSVAGYFCNVDAGFEYFYSWPYATMASEQMHKVAVECSTTEDAQSIEKVLASSGETGVFESAVYLQGPSGVCEAKAFGVTDTSRQALDRTKFNSLALGEFCLTDGEAVISRNLARSLGVKEGDSVCLRQNEKEISVDVRVSKVVRSYGVTSGVLVSASSLEGFRWDALELYGGDVPPALQPWLFETPITLSRQDACADAKTQAREFLPFARTNLKQQLAFALCAACSLALGALAERDLRRRLHIPLRGIGCPVRLLAETMGFALVGAGFVLALIGMLASALAMQAEYGMVESAWQMASTFAVLWVGSLMGNALVFAAWRWKLGS